ncbi:MAG: hypothetical protein JSS12_07055, partial [Verrucomicrobia bacterium]|nr:hypothetical protein [Verrucomicrobiota bacterium]
NIQPPPPVEQQKKPPTLPPLPPLYTGESPATEPISSSHTVDRTIKSRFQAAVAAFKDIFGVGVLRWSPTQTAKIRKNLIQHATKLKGGSLTTLELNSIDSAIDQLKRINSARKSAFEPKELRQANWTVRDVTTITIGSQNYEMLLGRNMKALLMHNSNRLIGEGGFGSVREVGIDLKPNIAVLHKMGNKNAFRLPEDLENEVKLPKLLHERAGGFQSGIQRAPYSIMHIVSPTEIRWGVYVHRYARTLEHHNVANLDMKPKELLQGLFTGVRAVHNAGMAHRDIKPENTGLQRNPKGRFESCLADFGLASSKEKLSKVVSGTPWFLTVMDFSLQDRTTLSDDTRLDLQQKQDIYALGVTTLMTMASQLVTLESVEELYKAIETHGYNGSQRDQPLRDNKHITELLNIIEEDCGPKISSLLYAMLNPDPRLRPSAKQAEVDFKGGFRG